VADRITTVRAVEHVANHNGINIAQRRAALLANGWDDLSADLFCEALDLAADLIDARATIDALRAELAGTVPAREHARAVRIAIECLEDAIGWADSDVEALADLEFARATLTHCGLTDADAIKAADGGE